MAVTDSPLQIEAATSGETMVCRLAGSATMDTCEQLNEELSRAAENKPALLVIDLERLEFICSLGLGAIVTAYLRARRYGGRLCLTAPQPAVRELIEMTKLAVLFPVCESVEEALQTP